MTSPLIFDESALLGSMPPSMGIDSSLARKLISLFVKETATLVEAIENAVMVADVKSVLEKSHALKSSSAAIGASEIAILAKALESASKLGSAETLTETVVHLRAAYERFCAEPSVQEVLKQTST